MSIQDTIIIPIIISLIAGVVSSYVTHILVERSDRLKWKHVKNELLDSQRYLCNQILTSIRLFLNINIPSGFLRDEESVFDFLKKEMIENIVNYESALKFPDKERAEIFVSNISSALNELNLQRDRFLLFKHSKPDYYEDCSIIINSITKSLMPIRTFPEVVDRELDKDVRLHGWRQMFLDEMNYLMKSVYEARLRTLNEKR